MQKYLHTYVVPCVMCMWKRMNLHLSLYSTVDVRVCVCAIECGQIPQTENIATAFYFLLLL